jgi:hypothetical protein
MVVSGRVDVIGSAWRWAIFHTPPSHRNTSVARSAVTTVSSWPATLPSCCSIWRT